MKYNTLLSGILLILVIIGIIFGFNQQSKAQQSLVQPTLQQDVVDYLEERLKKQDVPVIQITILQVSPLQIEITTQSQSDGEEWMPEDFVYFHLVRREIILANIGGYAIDRYTEIMLNKHGESIAWISIKAEERAISYMPPPSTSTDESTMGLVNENMNTYGMVVASEEISSLEGFQTLSLNLSTTSLDEANKVIPQFIDSLHSLAMDINAQGGRVIMIRAEIKDENGNILLDYLLDLQLDMETWWKADGITDSRFSHPGPPTPAPEELFTPTPLPTVTPMATP
jgi:hypothetical protein